MTDNYLMTYNQEILKPNSLWQKGHGYEKGFVVLLKVRASYTPSGKITDGLIYYFDVRTHETLMGNLRWFVACHSLISSLPAHEK